MIGRPLQNPSKKIWQQNPGDEHSPSITITSPNSIGIILRDGRTVIKTPENWVRMLDALNDIYKHGCSCSNDPHDKLCDSCIAGSALGWERVAGGESNGQ